MQKTFLVLVCVLLMTPLICGADPHACSQPFQLIGGEMVALVGILNKSKEWGPPNFGESPRSDSKIEIWSITLPNSVSFSIVENSKQTILRGNRIQVTSSPSHTSLSQRISLVGQVVTVKGRLWQATSAGDYTPITIEPNELKTFTGESGNAICF